MNIPKNTIKKWSTWANGISLVLSAFMLYAPQVFPDNQAVIMMICSVVVAACQFIKQGNLGGLNGEE